jgi:hypothetical protein
MCGACRVRRALCILTRRLSFFGGGLTGLAPLASSSKDSVKLSFLRGGGNRFGTTGQFI